MPKINRKEYEVLKGLDDKWKWIAKIRGMGLVAFDIAPKKYGNSKDWVYARSSQRKELDRNLLQFVEYDDDYPYSIAELIEEYEKDYKGSWEHAIEFSKEMRRESEETEVKDLEWLKSWFEDDKLYVGEYVKHKINQLDEPEITEEQAWEVIHGKYGDEVLQNNIDYVESQGYVVIEKPTLPPFVVEFIAERQDWANYEIFGDDYLFEEHNDVAKWLYDNAEDINRKRELDITLARNDYPYEVEEEQKYYVIDKEENILLIRGYGGIEKADNLKISNSGGGALKLTEQEIKDYDERYWPFAVKVEEIDNA